jgi:hypothetical protein
MVSSFCSSKVGDIIEVRRVHDSAGVRVGLQLSILNLMRTFLMKSGWFKNFSLFLIPMDVKAKKVGCW